MGNRIEVAFQIRDRHKVRIEDRIQHQLRRRLNYPTLDRWVPNGRGLLSALGIIFSRTACRR